MNEELKAIYDADQELRKNWDTTGTLESRLEDDRNRRRLVEDIITKDDLHDGDDYYHAGMVYQHGETPEDYLQANELFKRAVDLGSERALRMVAASIDRYMISIGEPYQKYGTNFRRDNVNDPNSLWYAYPIDPNTTDEERAEYNVRSRAEIDKRVEEMNREDGLIP